MILNNLSVDNVFFPDRKSLIRSDVHLDNIVEEIKKVDLEKTNFETEDFQPKTRIIQKQKVYFWIRIYIKEEIDIQPETKLTLTYLDGKEELETYFMYFGKKGLERDKDGQIVNFNPEDDRRILCLLIDSDNIDKDNEKIPYMKTLFPLGKHYQPQYIRKFDFSLVRENGELVDFYAIDF